MPTTSRSTNVDIVESIYGAFARGDLDAVLGHLDPTVCWRTPPTLPWFRGDYQGREEVVEYFTAFLAALGEPAVIPDEFIDAGARVIVHGHEQGRAATTEVPFRARFTHSWTLRDGLVSEMRGVVDTAAVCAAFTAAAAA